LVLLVLLSCKKPHPPLNYEDEGTVSNPVWLSVGSTRQGTVGKSGTSYYRFNAAADGSHTIALTNTQSDLGWYLYDNLNFPFGFELNSCDVYFDAADEIASTASLTFGDTYYLGVDEWDDVAGTFSLTITYP